jgi:amino acid transporter
MQPILDLLFYLFTPNPPKDTQLIYLYGFISVVIISASVFIKLHLKKNNKDKALRRSIRAYPSKLITTAVILLIYTFFRYAGAPLFSMRIILVLILVSLAYTLYKLYRSFTIEYPSQKRHLREQEERNKYLPRKKKK